VLCLFFSLTTIIPVSYAQSVFSPQLPVAGTLMLPSQAYSPTLIKGITIHPQDPLQMNFIIDPGQDNLNDIALKNKSEHLIKYFLAALTIPEDQMWVNLSPYEEDRIVADSFGKTDMGQDLLALDYLLKQLTSSLMYPEEEIGKEFWERVYQRAYNQFGTTEIPFNTFNKIWILPDTASVYEHENTVYVVDSKLKVMLEEDYFALESHQAQVKHNTDLSDQEIVSGVSLEIIREVLIPEIEKEINEGENFANLRQIYNAVILAKWYKTNLKGSLLDQVYVDQEKTAGLENFDADSKEKIYNQYLEAFKVGVFDYIKEDIDPISQETIPRKYFSGGADLTLDLTQATLDSNTIGNSPINDVTVEFINLRRPSSDTSSPVEDSDKVDDPKRRNLLTLLAAGALLTQFPAGLVAADDPAKITPVTLPISDPLESPSTFYQVFQAPTFKPEITAYIDAIPDGGYFPHKSLKTNGFIDGMLVKALEAKTVAPELLKLTLTFFEANEKFSKSGDESYLVLAIETMLAINFKYLIWNGYYMDFTLNKKGSKIYGNFDFLRADKPEDIHQIFDEDGTYFYTFVYSSVGKKSEKSKYEGFVPKQFPIVFANKNMIINHTKVLSGDLQLDDDDLKDVLHKRILDETKGSRAFRKRGNKSRAEDVRDRMTELDFDLTRKSYPRGSRESTINGHILESVILNEMIIAYFNAREQFFYRITRNGVKLRDVSWQ